MALLFWINSPGKEVPGLHREAFRSRVPSGKGVIRVVLKLGSWVSSQITTLVDHTCPQ